MGQQWRRLKSNEEDHALARESRRAYNEFVIALHERLRTTESTQKVKFTHGNPWKKVLVGLVLIALIMAIPMSWHFGHYRYLFAWIVSFILLFLFYMRINFKKNYSPETIPQKYLPGFL